MLWTLVWLIVLAGVLTRKDMEPIQQLMWVLVIILVPFFGVLLYWTMAPNAPTQAQTRDYANEPTVCVQCGAVIKAGSNACSKCGWSSQAKG